MSNSLVSITITTKNEERNIQNCLESIRLQTYKNIEIIVVDNHSTDKTKDIAKKYTDKVFDKGPERSAQRNYGMIDQSKGKYVMFADADMIFSPNLIASCVEKIENCPAAAGSRLGGDKLKIENCQLVGLHIPEIVLGKKFFSRVRRFERSFYDGTVIDGARFFSKKAFVKVGGFDETMSGPEDWDIDKKIKQIGKIGLLNSDPTHLRGGVARHNFADVGGAHLRGEGRKWPLEDLILEKGINPSKYGTVIYHNEAEFDLKKYLAKKGYYAQSFETYVNKWGKNDPDIKKQLGFSYRFFGVFTEEGKWLKLLTHPLLTLGMYFLRILVGVKFVFRKK